MSLESAKKVPLSRFSHSVRASQATLQYGVGAMVDFPEQTLMTAAPEYWASAVTKIHDERLERLLGVSCFGLPGNEESAEGKNGISYVRFPQWYFCPKCRKFQTIRDWTREYKQKAPRGRLDKDPDMIASPRCSTDGQMLVVARIVVVCEHGHIDDFPWVKWVHYKNRSGPRKICEHPVLEFKTGTSATEGLEGLTINCRSCHASATLRDAFRPDIFKQMEEKTQGKCSIRCTGSHPWKHQKEPCNLFPRTLQRGSSSVYFPVVQSSLVIPPYSNLLTKKIEESPQYEDGKKTLTGALSTLEQILQMNDSLTADERVSMRKNIVEGQLKTISKKIALDIGVDSEKVENVLQRKWESPIENGGSTSAISYRAEEYAALNGEIEVPADDYGDFIRESVDIRQYGLPFLSSISLIHKIREVQALTGFTRINPAEESEDGSPARNVVPVKEQDTDWYPAYQVRGEGIFITFDDSQIKDWERNNPVLEKRVAHLNENKKVSYISGRGRPITAKYLLLHTLAHLLIKQLSFECGYGIASLKERIYCSEADEGREMSGMLLYTAGGDSEGTLGGLVRQGRFDTFPILFRKALLGAITCSNDPVCSLSMGQGRDSLNLAACYSCALLPETSCEQFNVFLDRGVLVGTQTDPHFGFFSKFLQTGTFSEYKNADKRTLEAPLKQPVILTSGDGVDCRELSYSEIWNDIARYTESVTEKALIKAAILKFENSNKEKPLEEKGFVLGTSQDEYVAQLAWVQSKVLYFSDDSKEEYEIAKNGTWTVFYGGDPNLTAEILFSAIKEM